MAEHYRCPLCGAPLVQGALAGLCPACLLLQGVAADSVTGADARAFEAPSVSDLAPLFPQLEVFELIGQGGMGAVYKARQKELDRVVALKILPPDMGNTPGFAERFSREAKALAKLNHPGIVTIHEFGRADGLFYFVMEFVDGVNLRQLLARGRVAPREPWPSCRNLDALQFAHDHGIVHRDIKPANILLDRRGRVKVADFGLAKLAAESGDGTAATAATAGASLEIGLSETGKTMGTPDYMAPEQNERPGEVDHRADIYALGVVFYQMLTGELPAGEITPPSRKVVLDVRLDEVVLRALEKKPEFRYQKVSSVKEAVETIANTTVGATAAAGAPSPIGSDAEGSIPKNRVTRFVISAVAVAAMGAMIWWAASVPSAAPAGLEGGAGQSGPVRVATTHNETGALEGARPNTPAALESSAKEPRTVQVAAINPETGVLEVTVPDGGALRLLAVSSADQPNRWWRPDGKPATDTGITIRGEPATREPEAIKEHFFLWDFRDARGRASLSHEDLFEPHGEQVYLSSVDQDGKLLDGVTAVRMRFASSPRTVTFRTEIGLENWRTISTLDPHKRHYVLSAGPGTPTFHGWDDPVQTSDGIEIGMIIKADPRFEARIIPVDRNGVRYFAFGEGAIPIGDFILRKFSHFKPFDGDESSPELTLEAAKEFQAQVEPLVLVEFRDIVLQPNKPPLKAPPK